MLFLHIITCDSAKPIYRNVLGSKNKSTKIMSSLGTYIHFQIQHKHFTIGGVKNHLQGIFQTRPLKCEKICSESPSSYEDYLRGICSNRDITVNHPMLPCPVSMNIDKDPKLDAKFLWGLFFTVNMISSKQSIIYSESFGTNKQQPEATFCDHISKASIVKKHIEQVQFQILILCIISLGFVFDLQYFNV